jgi:Cu2+-exporting ATPase
MLAEVESVRAVADGSTCFHCGEPARAGALSSRIDGRDRTFCCTGCLAIAQTIAAAGLAPYYAQRTSTAAPVERDDDAGREAAHALAAGLVGTVADGHHECALLLEGMHCGACVWLIETWLARKPYVVEASANFATRRARVRWRGDALALADVMRDIAAIGYRARPYDPARRESLLRRESRSLLLRMGVAVLASMQVMMLAVPTYLADDPLEPALKGLLDWASLVITLPVVSFCAAPFFTGAWRSVRGRMPGMDVPIVIAVTGAFLASAWATIAGHGDTWYDSVTMFVALLLLARCLEHRARAKAARTIESVAPELPPTAERLAGSRVETVPASALRVDDRVRVAAGACVPADGLIVEGTSSVEEALLTGESRPLRKAPGDRLLAGAVNRESPLVMRVTAAGASTTLASLSRLVERAAEARPHAARVAERAAVGFVVLILAVAGVAALYWSQHDASRVLPVVFAILVVSCPCALSLATPAAMTAAAGALGRRGVLTLRADALESLARASHVVFDKTGTLTVGRPRVAAVDIEGRIDRNTCLAIAAALEAGASHPVAAAFRDFARDTMGADNVQAIPGEGVEGWIDGRRYRCGRPAWVAASHPGPGDVASDDAILVALADDDGWLATFVLEDALRDDSAALVGTLRALGKDVTLLSGDRQSVVRRVAERAGIEWWRGELRPEAKRAFIRRLQDEGARVAMVGDGLNDAPSLAQADVSIALGDAATLTRWTADIVVLGDKVRVVGEAFAIARRTLRIVRQNLGWAVAYNVLAVPLAAAGLVSPLAASIGMAASSLVVVGNAMRLGQTPRQTGV